MKTILQLSRWAEWAASIIGLGLMLMAIIGLLFKVNILGFADMLSFFQTANSFFLLAIVLFLFRHFSKYNKE